VEGKSLWSKVDAGETSITYYGKEGTTWEQMNQWLETELCEGECDQHWDWRGFGTAGTADFKVIVVRKACSPFRCNATSCDNCGRYSCCLEMNDEGDDVCGECETESESDDE
jgi:hypothetical protein